MKSPAVILSMAFLALTACHDDRAEMHRRAKDIASSFRFNWQAYQKDGRFDKLTVGEFVQYVEAENIQHGRANRSDLVVTVTPSSVVKCVVDGTDRSADNFTVTVRVKDATATAEFEFKPR